MSENRNKPVSRGVIYDQHSDPLACFTIMICYYHNFLLTVAFVGHVSVRGRIIIYNKCLEQVSNFIYFCCDVCYEGENINIKGKPEKVK